jgi:cephalosporin hydroxylase
MFAPKDIATRLRLNELDVVRRAYHGVEAPRYFARGYRFARSFPQVAVPRVQDSDASDLREYAEAHDRGPGLTKWEHYFAIYDRHLARFRGDDVSLIEIGVAGGGSIGMWRDYLGDGAHICGIDIDPRCERFASADTEIVIGDQGSPSFWEAFLAARTSPIDVVIDDGGHTPLQQVMTLERLLPLLAPGGVYICEDIHGAFQPFHAFVDGLTRPLNDIGDAPNPANALQKQIASVHRYPILTVIEKVNHERDAFHARRYGTEWPEDWAADCVPTVGAEVTSAANGSTA